MRTTTEPVIPKLRFAREFTERDALEAQDRGYLSHVLVELDEGRLYPIFFYDATRLQQDLTEGVRSGRPFVADPGMIVVPEVTLPAMTAAVTRLVGEGFFEHLVPLTDEDLGNGNPYRWPPERRSGQ
jgi:hypothetical protein